MEIEHIKGLVVAPLVPYKSDGEINPKIITNYAKFLSDNGIVGVFVNGTTGEGLSLTVDERKEIAEAWVKAAPKSLKVLIHTGHTSFSAFKELALHAQDIGAHAIGAIGQIYFRPSNVEQLAAQSKKEAKIVSEMPYYYYHIPSLTGINLPMYPYLKKMDETTPNFAGIKYTFETLMDYSLCRFYKGGKYDILFGRDEMLLPALTMGAEGMIGSTYNISASLYYEIIKNYRRHNLERASQLQRYSHSLIQLMLRDGKFFAALKTTMKELGIDFGSVRPPLVDFTDEEREKYLNDFKKLDIVKFLNK